MDEHPGARSKEWVVFNGSHYFLKTGGIDNGSMRLSIKREGINMQLRSFKETFELRWQLWLFLFSAYT